MSNTSSILQIGSALAEVFTFLAPVEQQELRTTNTVAAQWFDNAAENGCLSFYAHSIGQKWKYSPVHPHNAETPDTVTANVRNYFFSTLNDYSLRNDAIAKPRYPEGDDHTASDVVVHNFILQGFKCNKLFVTGLNGIKSIANRFCEYATAEHIEFDGANQLQSIGMHFMSFAPNLKTVVFKGAMPCLKSVHYNFLSNCLKLESVDFSGLIALESVTDRWFYNCPALANVDFTPFAKTLHRIGPCFLNKVTKIQNLDQRLAVLTEIKELAVTNQFSPKEYVAFAKTKPVMVLEGL